MGCQRGVDVASIVSKDSNQPSGGFNSGFLEHIISGGVIEDGEMSRSLSHVNANLIAVYNHQVNPLLAERPGDGFTHPSIAAEDNMVAQSLISDSMRCLPF